MFLRILALVFCAFMATPATAVTTTTYTGTVWQNPSGGPSGWSGDPLGIFGGLYLHGKAFSLIVQDAVFQSLTIGGVTTTATPTSLVLPSSSPGTGSFQYSVREVVYCGMSNFHWACFPAWNLPPLMDSWVEYTVFTAGSLEVASISTGTISPVPVPAGIVLLGSALLVLLGWHRRGQLANIPATGLVKVLAAFAAVKKSLPLPAR